MCHCPSPLLRTCRCVLVGIAPGAPERPQLVKGFMQLYSVEQSRSQVRNVQALAPFAADRCCVGWGSHLDLPWLT